MEAASDERAQWHTAQLGLLRQHVRPLSAEVAAHLDRRDARDQNARTQLHGAAVGREHLGARRQLLEGRSQGGRPVRFDEHERRGRAAVVMQRSADVHAARLGARPLIAAVATVAAAAAAVSARRGALDKGDLGEERRARGVAALRACLV